MAARTSPLATRAWADGQQNPTYPTYGRPSYPYTGFAHHDDSSYTTRRYTDPYPTSYQCSDPYHSYPQAEAASRYHADPHAGVLASNDPSFYYGQMETGSRYHPARRCGDYHNSSNHSPTCNEFESWASSSRRHEASDEDEETESPFTDYLQPGHARTAPAERPTCLHPQCLDEHGRPTKTFLRDADVQRHMRAEHADPMFDCPRSRCFRKGQNGFTDQDHLIEHRRQYHGEDIPKRSGRMREAEARHTA